MFVRHRLVVIAGLIAAVVAVVIALRAGASAPQSASLTWGAAPSASAAPGAPGAGAAPSWIPVPIASPRPTASTAPLGGLQLPLSALFRQLNSETRNTAVGQYSILNAIGDAIRDRVRDFLNWVTDGR